MQSLKHTVLAAALITSASVSADTVTGEVVDTMPGKAVAGTSGFLLAGFASGGPVGALVGGGLGWYLGDKAQQSIGVGDIAYQVRTSEGELLTVRSPNESWSVGDEVQIVGNRLVAKQTALAASTH